MKKSLVIAGCLLLVVACKNKAAENAETPNNRSLDVIDITSFKDDRTVTAQDLRAFRGCGPGHEFLTHDEVRAGDQQYVTYKQSRGGRTTKKITREIVSSASRRTLRITNKVLSLEMDRVGEILRNPIEYDITCRESTCDLDGGEAALARVYDEAFNEVGQREIRTFTQAPNCRLQTQGSSTSVRYGLFTLKNGAQVRAALETNIQTGDVICGSTLSGRGSKETLKVLTTEILPLNTRDICRGTAVVEASRLKLNGGQTIESYQIEITEPEML